MKLIQLRVAVTLVVLGVCSLAIGAGGPAAAPVVHARTDIPAQTAIDWNVIAVTTVRGATPAKFQIEGLIYMSYVQAAVYDAVTAIDHRYKPYRRLDIHAPHASMSAAVAAAAYSTLVYYFPAQAPALTSTYTNYLTTTLAALSDDERQAGVAVGAAAAADLIASRWGDGRDAPVGTAFGVAPQPVGTWVFAPPPSGQSAQTPWIANMRPFMLDSSSQFRPPAPPALTSPEYATDLNEVKSLGSAGSVIRTPEQTAIAQFWNANVINQYNQVFRDVATTHGFDLLDSVRLLAMGNMISTDAGIACMDAKYHYLLWRPITAIRAADLDGNAATDVDAGWSPLLTTPNHPEYPSAHGCVTSAVTSVLRSVLKTDAIEVEVPGATLGGSTLTTSRHFDTGSELLTDVANARVWAGLHYRFATTAGVTLGTSVAEWDLKHNFRK